MSEKLIKIENQRLKFEHLALLWLFLVPLTGIIILSLTVYFGYWYLALAYLSVFWFQSILEIESKEPNKRRDHYIFTMFKEYFDMKIIKTSNISPTKNYIFCYHPHGIVPYGMFSALNSNCCGFDDLYPGIKLNLKVGAVNLGFPLLKEIGLYFGVQLVSKKSIKKTLAKKGNSVVLNIGGGAEMIFSVPRTAKLIIKNRYGFIKIALETGSDLVPVYAFGENSTYNQSPVDQTSSSFWLKREFYKKTNFFLPMISGRGIFPNTTGAFPLNVPIRIVIGKPIKVEKVERPTEEQIHELYDRYCSELLALYNEYKDEFWYDKDSQAPKLELLENPLR